MNNGSESVLKIFLVRLLFRFFYAAGMSSGNGSSLKLVMRASVSIFFFSENGKHLLATNSFEEE